MTSVHTLHRTGDLKPALTAAINAILKPVRDHFANDPAAKGLLKKVKVGRACSISIVSCCISSTL